MGATGYLCECHATGRRQGGQKVAPCHCTGDRATGAFVSEFGDDYLQGGVGWVITIGSGEGGSE